MAPVSDPVSDPVSALPLVLVSVDVSVAQLASLLVIRLAKWLVPRSASL